MNPIVHSNDSCPEKMREGASCTHKNTKKRKKRKDNENKVAINQGKSFNPTATEQVQSKRATREHNIVIIIASFANLPK